MPLQAAVRHPRARRRTPAPRVFLPLLFLTTRPAAASASAPPSTGRRLFPDLRAAATSFLRRLEPELAAHGAGNQPRKSARADLGHAFAGASRRAAEEEEGQEERPEKAATGTGDGRGKRTSAEASAETKGRTRRDGTEDLDGMVAEEASSPSHPVTQIVNYPVHHALRPSTPSTPPHSRVRYQSRKNSSNIRRRTSRRSERRSSPAVPWCLARACDSASSSRAASRQVMAGSLVNRRRPF
jgi:hypothetical protein